MCIFSFAAFQAQERIVKVDSATGGRLVIEADKNIMNLIDDKTICREVIASSEPKPVSKPISPANLCQRQNTIQGYMIKIGEAKSEEEVNKMMNTLRSQFPDLRVEKNYLRPDWRLLAGDFMTKQSAQADFKRVKNTFPNAVLFNWRIYCNRAK